MQSLSHGKKDDREYIEQVHCTPSISKVQVEKKYSMAPRPINYLISTNKHILKSNLLLMLIIQKLRNYLADMHVIEGGGNYDST